ncbi:MULTISPECIES: GerMN domain-containing protein [Paenibacillus]|uniref:GerMN domain-containing protein n=1 Tax=Paenibacillus xylanilyticus TaxID=248903 RepID=A0A7Y6BXC2_9BACL|nr:GerMN domain-containing protein [Paenibacillus xylanilyticus]NUU76216.1 GerMN domain-containing protein [Paenibacillus xylanilyticus]
MKRKMGYVLLFSFILMIAVGCAQKPVSESGTNEPKQSGSVQPPNNSGTQVEPNKEQKQTVEVFFADTQVLELKKREVELAFADNVDADKYKKTFEALQNNDDAQLVSLWEKVELLSIEFAEDTVTLDVHIPDEAKLGTSGELLALEALTTTMFQFDEVKRLDVLVDGEAVDSLMGHSELEHPIQRES